MLSPRIQFFLARLNYYLQDVSTAELKEAHKFFQQRISDLSKKYTGMGAEIQESSIVRELGEPKDAAREYCKTRNIPWIDPEAPDQKPKTFRSWKLLILLALCILAAIYHFYFDPSNAELKKVANVIALQVGAQKEVAKILGSTEENKMGTPTANGIPKPESIKGTYSVSPNAQAATAIRQVDINFEKGNWTIFWRNTADVSWECSGTDQLQPKPEGNKLNLKIATAPDLQCNLILPLNLALKIIGGDGRITLQEPEVSLSVELASGTIAFIASPKHKYNFRNNVKAGMTANLESSNEPGAIPIFLSMGNGKIVGQTTE